MKDVSNVEVKYFVIKYEGMKKIAVEVYNETEEDVDTLLESVSTDRVDVDECFGALKFYRMSKAAVDVFIGTDCKYTKLAILLETVVDTYLSKRKRFFVQDIYDVLGIKIKMKDMKSLYKVYSDLGIPKDNESLCILISTRKDTQSLLSYFSNTAVVEESKKEVEVSTDTAVTTITDIQERAKVDSDFAEFLEDIKPTNVKLKADSYSTDFSDFEF